jgi:lipopolysaccharide/colanic/teichoic acid biosynthesis glycosyltransferase
MMKRFFDLILSVLALVMLAPFSALLLVILRVESAAPVLTRSHRVGKNGRMVKVWEFRTALAEPDAMETVGGCHGEQVTRVGAVLRRSGVARWPLLLNVIRGDFSLVGPRVEMPRYVGCYPTDIRKSVLSIKPGLFDLATINFRQEARLMADLHGDDLEEFYVEKILPVRLDYAQRYVEQQDIWLDFRILLFSCLRIFQRETSEAQAK